MPTSIKNKLVSSGKLSELSKKIKSLDKRLEEAFKSVNTRFKQLSLHIIRDLSQLQEQTQTTAETQWGLLSYLAEQRGITPEELHKEVAVHRDRVRAAWFEEKKADRLAALKEGEFLCGNCLLVEEREKIEDDACPRCEEKGVLIFPQPSEPIAHTEKAE